MFQDYKSGSVPAANRVENSFLTSHLVSSIASECVNNMQSFFSACGLGGMPAEAMKKGSPTGDKFRIPIGLSDAKNVYTKEAFEFDFEKARFSRQFAMEGIIGLWIPEYKEYYVNAFLRPIIVSLINEASAHQFQKFMDNAVIFTDSAPNVFSSFLGTIRCNPTPDINALIKYPSMLLAGDNFGNAKAQILHNHGINALGLLGTGKVSAVGNLYSSKALSGLASFNKESMMSGLLNRFSVVNQTVGSDYSRPAKSIASTFFYSDVTGSIEGPISVFNVTELTYNENNEIVQIAFNIDPKVRTVLGAIIKDSASVLININAGEALSICGEHVPYFVNRAGGISNAQSKEGFTVVATESKKISLNNVTKITLNIRPVLVDDDNVLDDRSSDYAPVVHFQKNNPVQGNLFSFSGPIIQQTCDSTLKMEFNPWIVCDPVIFMVHNTPYQYVRPPELVAVESDDVDYDHHGAKSIEAMVYNQGSVINSKNTVKIDLFVDAGINKKTYAIGMIPRVINYSNGDVAA